MLGMFWKTCQQKNKIRKKRTEHKNKHEHHSWLHFNSVQDAPILKLWGPFFDDSGDISIFMIWGSWGDLGQDWLDWQIWPSGRELGSQSQAPGSIPPAPLVGSNLCASRQCTLRGSCFAKMSVLKMINNAFPGFT